MSRPIPRPARDRDNPIDIAAAGQYLRGRDRCCNTAQLDRLPLQPEGSASCLGHRVQDPEPTGPRNRVQHSYGCDVALIAMAVHAEPWSERSLPFVSLSRCL